MILISNLTLRLVFPIVSNTSLSTSPVGNGLGLRAEGRGDAGVAKSLGIGGRTLVLFDEDSVECVTGE
jgi:hypothetical protein